MLQVNVRCPYCKKSLMYEEKEIDGYPSIIVIIQYRNKRGKLYLSSVYGSYNTIFESSFMPLGEIAVFFCPECNSVLYSKSLCEKCQASMTAFEFIEGGKVQVCSRYGCKKHFIEFENIEKELSAFYNAYPLFFGFIGGKKKKKDKIL